MSGRLQGKVAIITGASSGIGRAIALAYHREGAKVVCADLQERSRNAAESKASTHEHINDQGGAAIFVTTDVTSESQIEALVGKAVEQFGRVDIMVNNAGIGIIGDVADPVWAMPLAKWEKTQAINSTGVFLGTKHAAAQMLKQEPHASGDRGWVINTASVLGYVGTEGAVAYAAAKGAVVNLTRSAALDCGPHRIHVNAICPGYTSSEMTRQIFENEDRHKYLLERHGFAGRLGEPEDLARACVFLASEDARWVTGVALPVDGGYLAR